MMDRFVLNPDVFVWEIDGHVLFYDSLSSKKVFAVSSPFTAALQDIDRLYAAVPGTVDEENLCRRLEMERMGYFAAEGDLACSLPPVPYVNDAVERMPMDWDIEDNVLRSRVLHYLEKVTVYGIPGDDGRFDDLRRRCVKSGVAFEVLQYGPGDHGEKVFSDDMLLDAGDLEHLSPTKRVVFIHQMVNPNFWGRLWIFPDGGVYPMPVWDETCRIGSVSDPLPLLVARELLLNLAWRKVRGGRCVSCLFRWLCPSVSVPEMASGYGRACYGL